MSVPQEAKDLGHNINYVTGGAYGPDIGLTGFISGSGGPHQLFWLSQRQQRSQFSN